MSHVIALTFAHHVPVVKRHLVLLLMAHFLSCVMVLTVTKIARIPPTFVYELFLFKSSHKLSFLRGNRTVDRNRDFKAALFQVASSVGFLSQFSRNFPSMFYKEAKSGTEFDWDVSDNLTSHYQGYAHGKQPSHTVVLVAFFQPRSQGLSSSRSEERGGKNI